MALAAELRREREAAVPPVVGRRLGIRVDEAEERLRLGAFEVDARVCVDGKPVPLTKKESSAKENDENDAPSAE